VTVRVGALKHVDGVIRSGVATTTGTAAIGVRLRS